MKQKVNFNKQNNALRIFKAMANANRIKILGLISDAGKDGISVNEITKKLGLTQGNVSTHLKMLRISKIVKAQQDGLNMHYSINEPLVVKLLEITK